jgi:hypothetical protein
MCRHEAPHLIDTLAARFPAAFNVHAPVPLAIGIHREILAAIGDAMPRYRIISDDAGEVTDEHRRDRREAGGGAARAVTSRDNDGSREGHHAGLMRLSRVEELLLRISRRLPATVCVPSSGVRRHRRGLSAAPIRAAAALVTAFGADGGGTVPGAGTWRASTGLGGSSARSIPRR